MTIIPDKNIARVDVIVRKDNFGPEAENEAKQPVNLDVQINSSNHGSCCFLLIRNFV